MVEIKELSFQYKGANTFALENIDFTVKKGDFVGIIVGRGQKHAADEYEWNCTVLLSRRLLRQRLCVRARYGGK